MKDSVEILNATSSLNRDFWNEPCGSQMLRSMGLTDYSPAAIEKFDQAFFGYYPYLSEFIPHPALEGKDILEVGLGMGSVARYAASLSRTYVGVDIASGPVELVINSVSPNAAAKAVCASVFELPFENAVFDVAISIGCLHHTGSVKKSVSELARVLRKGGRLNIMIYNRYSARRLWRYPVETLMSAFKNRTEENSSNTERQEYDSGSAGDAAPYTAFLSSGDIRKLLIESGFKNIKIQKRNMDSINSRGRILLGRNVTRRLFESVLGLDLYITAIRV
jgi:SAM-dependent methyltransferase